jgi:hypothetical protein
MGTTLDFMCLDTLSLYIGTYRSSHHSGAALR